ncbi:MAG: hypothetical protein QM780_01425 [Hyphomicrobium sp.]|uniref:hypothetical protein n=1 Tax=Hyphomicrobium sp. TaxID=82 RepID=UPI0039E66CC5
MRTVSTAAIPTIDRPKRVGERSGSARLVGVAIASLIPAVFWSAIIELGAAWLGKPLSSATIAVIGMAIALFLFAVCAPLMLRKPSAEVETRVRTAKTSA